MATAIQSINAYKPAKGAKLAVTLKDGTIVEGKVTKAGAFGLKLDDEAINYRRVDSISFRGRVVAQRRTPGKDKPAAAAANGAKPAKRGRSKKKIGRRPTTSTRGRKPKAAASTDVAVTVSATALVFTKANDTFQVELAMLVDADTRAQLVDFGVAEA